MNFNTKYCIFIILSLNIPKNYVDVDAEHVIIIVTDKILYLFKCECLNISSKRESFPNVNGKSAFDFLD